MTLGRVRKGTKSMFENTHDEEKKSPRDQSWIGYAVSESESDSGAPHHHRSPGRNTHWHSDCRLGSTNTHCQAAFLGIHLTPLLSAYFEVYIIEIVSESMSRPTHSLLTIADAKDGE